MKRSRLILSIVMLLGFSSHAGACIINLGDGDFYYKGLTITRHQSLVNNYLSLVWPARNVSSSLPGSSIGHILSDADLRSFVSNVSFLNNLKTEDLGFTGSYGHGQIGREDNNPAPVPEPATMLLLGTGLIGLAGFRKKMKR